MPAFLTALFCAGADGAGTGAVAVWAIKPVVARDRRTETRMQDFFMGVGMTRQCGAGYAVDKKRCSRDCVRSFPRTRKMAVRLGPALVPDTASRAAAW